VIERLRLFCRPVGQDELPHLALALTHGTRIACLVLVTLAPMISVVEIFWGDFTVWRVLAMIAVVQPLVWCCFGLTFTAFGRRHAESLLVVLVTISNVASRFAGMQSETGQSALAMVGVLSPMLLAAFAPWRPMLSLVTGISVALIWALAGLFAPPVASVSTSLAIVLTLAGALVAAAACQSQRRVWADLYRARRDAQIAAQAKSEFLATMSHEIRTPMTAILGFTDELLADTAREPSGPAPQSALLTIKRNGEQLLRLINDILDVAKLESGKLVPNLEVCAPREVVASVTELLRPSASEKGLRLETEVAAEVPQALCTDPTRVRQILVNLVGNAIKFTNSGEVRIRVGHLAARQGGGAKLVLEIVDTGIGLTLEQTSRLFEPFSQADGSMARRFGGTGLGLAISRRYARLLGGDISIESVPERGSVFRVTIPVSLPPAPKTGICAGSAPPAVMHGRVLLAEDGPDNRALIVRILERAGLQVDVASNGLEAATMVVGALLSGTPYDVVLMDMQMPETTGDEAVRALRADGYTGPIVALTAQALAGDREACLAAGCDDYAAKPIERAALLALLARFLEKPQA
jgi:signal transduction histidine kinase/CheY-like chemotaxis protein